MNTNVGVTNNYLFLNKPNNTSGEFKHLDDLFNKITTISTYLLQ